ncbi:carboxymuconolactone decarboxylase family protein [Coralloluteibacterium stylophorae]|uniref:Alkyl hydroperoxide reductase AhpD n=1 Tax=Coralloluteibacterium stylophorae TaxID=1776034 RepID=A0A8J7VU76_9GAMM|nr:carboxymuconolactone decarboxylase family protein [Coralloluteibacterium stylophorae]MBS7456137.1 carboxymuconolactone decarboxylase family protein [Coralloluteibacterium stylophorae]
MRLETVIDALPAYAGDLRQNLDCVLSERGSPGLDAKQIRAVALASAIAARHRPLTEAITAFAAEELDERELDGVRSVTMVMGMTNIYYRFTHLVSNREYGGLRAGLRVGVLADPGIDKLTFELAAMAVSAINGCGLCMDSHEKVLRERAVGAEAVQSAVRIAAVVNALAVTLEQPRDAGAGPGRAELAGAA